MLFLPIVQEILQSHSLVFCNPPNLPTHRCGAALDIILSTPTLPSCVTFHSGSHCCPLAPLCCLLLSSDHMLCSCHLDIPQTSLSPNSALFPSLPRVRDWSTVVAVYLRGTSLSWPTFLAHSLTFLRVLLSSTPSPKSSPTVHPFALVVAPPGPAHAQGNPFGGMMHAVTPLLLAMVLGVTSVALGHLRTRLVSASCVNSFTAQFVPPGPTSGTSGLGL